MKLLFLRIPYWKTVCFIQERLKVGSLQVRIVHPMCRRLVVMRTSDNGLKEMRLNALSPSPTKWSNALKQFVSKLLKNCLSVFDHFLGLALKGFALSLVNHFTKTIDHDHEATYLRNFSLVLLDILSVLCSAIIIFIIIIIKTIDIFWR